MNIFIKILVIYISLCILFSLILSLFDYTHFNGIKKEQDKGINRFYNRLYFTFTTISTVGYGDITPKSPQTRLIISLIMISISFTVFQALFEYFENKLKESKTV
jgi:hypothetical protein